VIGIVATAAREFERRFHESEFHVIVYDSDEVHSLRAVQGFEGAGLSVHRISDMIPGPRLLAEQDTVDGDHPTAAIYRRIADYLMRNVIGN